MVSSRAVFAPSKTLSRTRNCGGLEQGDQVLYDLTVSAAATQKTLKVGLRQIDLVTTAGRGWPWFQDLRQQARCLCERRKLDPLRRACRADHA